MALIKCPECGKENVSDTAETCPECGYNIKKYVTETMKEEARQKSDIQSTTSKKSPKIGIIIAVSLMFIIVIAFFVVKQNQRNEEAKQNVKVLISLTEDISEYRENAVMKLSDGSYMYYDAGADYAISEIYKTLTHLYSCIEYIDKHYSECPNVFNEEIYRGTNYSCKTWEEYKKRLNTNYHLDEELSDMERAEVIVSWYVDFKVD